MGFWATQAILWFHDNWIPSRHSAGQQLHKDWRLRVATAFHWSCVGRTYQPGSIPLPQQDQGSRGYCGSHSPHCPPAWVWGWAGARLEHGVMVGLAWKDAWKTGLWEAGVWQPWWAEIWSWSLGRLVRRPRVGCSVTVRLSGTCSALTMTW